MPQWDKKFVYQSFFINKTLQQVTDYEKKTETGKNQKLSRKAPLENVEAIQLVSSSLKTLSMILGTSSLNQWGLSAVG